MNALGYYLVISLFFVFGTVVEFALVLIVKQKLEWDGYFSGGANDGWKLERSPQENNFRCPNNVVNIDAIEEVVNDTNTTNEREMQQRRLRVQQLRFSKTLPLTTKIDFLAFLIFNFGYFIFNCIYFIHFG